jgi:hypothetical protein
MNDELRDRFKTACEGLYYISETDAPIEVVDDVPVGYEGAEVRSFDMFFAPLIAIHPGYREPQIERAKKFLELKSLLEGSLNDLAVYKFGGTRKTIYIVGRDAGGKLVGLRTEAVET